jgi:hypothetical protein
MIFYVVEFDRDFGSTWKGPLRDTTSSTVLEGPISMVIMYIVSICVRNSIIALTDARDFTDNFFVFTHIYFFCSKLVSYRFFDGKCVDGLKKSKTCETTTFFRKKPYFLFPRNTDEKKLRL